MRFPICKFGITLLVLSIVPMARADSAVLSNGFRLQVDRQEANGSGVRLFVSGGGFVDVQANDVVSYEKEDAPVAEAKPQPPTLPQLFQAAGAQHGLDPVFLKSMASAESGLNVKAISPKGAAGLMQLMPDTAASLGVSDQLNPGQNVHGGALYIRALIERYHGDVAKALAAYNAGPAKVDLYNGIPPYAETQQYVRRVIERFNREKTKESAKN
jgi:soluble lytic murein transglycosylase-like protein